MAEIAIVGAVVGMIGSAVSAMGTIAAGQAQKAAAEHQAKILEQKGKQERASAQRKAMEKREEEKRVQSALQARAAASGAGADDPGIITIASNVAKEGEYNALMDSFQGELIAWDYGLKADVARYEGELAEKGSKWSALGTILGSASNFLKTPQLRQFG